MNCPQRVDAIGRGCDFYSLRGSNSYNLRLALKAGYVIRLRVGDAKRKRHRFLARHPFCCFCGGSVAATTIDHIPARTCFRGRAYPETFEFPACDACNNASRIDEIAFSFFVKMVDQTQDNFEGSEANRTILSLMNNLPHLLPVFSRDGRQNRRSLKKFGLTKPPGSIFSELPMAAIADEAHDHIKRYARKIACALHYREKGRAASSNHQMVAYWGQLIDRNFMESVEGFLAMPNLEIGTRRNVVFGDQFAYRHIGADDPDVFGMIAQFGTGIVIASLIVANDVAARLQKDSFRDAMMEHREPWVAVCDNYA